MKKFFALALAVAAFFTVQAQQQDVKALYEQGKKLEKEYDKVKANPTPEGAEALMQAYDLYNQVMQAEEGTEKPKYSKKLQEGMLKRAMSGDFQNAAVALFNGGKKYPEAYAAFMMSGQGCAATGMVPDTICAIDFFNAGNSAYGTDFEAAAVAYDAAIAANIPQVDAYVYAIGARQNLSAQKPENKAEYDKQIHEIAQKGVQTFGYNQDFLFNNFLQYYFDQNRFDEALAELAKAEQADPTNANIYRLRGIIANAQHDYLASVPAFVKMAELTDKYDYLQTAAEDLNSVGKAILGSVTKVTPEAKQQILDIFNSAKKIAEKAKTAPGANAQKVDYIIDDIDYNIENANKL
ncbi:MAG: tetratricopeptide repeat protein [Prevotella sp.]|nr:tetratricopeptide repeat protein [Prevotella sp.]MCM1074701.1 tetratricopeptide repeat protein [Ruminococcus sp.]